jgi:hypothetical protein
LLVSAVLAVILIPSASAETIQVYGRRAVTYTSYPNDPTPTAKWVASAQGQDGLNAKGEVTSLQSRAAVRETFGITRVRIYDVTLQQYGGGTWKTVAQNAVDKTNSNSTAYAVSITPKVAYCHTDTSLKRTYRVVQHHGVRRKDGILANRTTVSSSFLARALNSDPGCPTFVGLDVKMVGPSELTVGEAPGEYQLTFLNPAEYGEPIDGPSAVVFVSEDLVVHGGSACAPPGPDTVPGMEGADLVCDLGGRMASGETRSLTLTIEGLTNEHNPNWVRVDFESTTPWAGWDTGSSHEPSVYQYVEVLVP